MPSASQLAGLKAYAAARADLVAAQGQQLTALSQSSGGLAAATARRDADVAALTAARRAALGKGDGFDLLAAAQPLLLLPVRLETRFAWLSDGSLAFNPVTGVQRSLLVRVIPDEIHEDAFEPALTDGETRLLLELQKALARARDSIDFTRAWNAVVTAVGPLRAGWFGEVLRNPALRQQRPDRYTRPAIARLLPDRWVATAELDDGSTRTALSQPVREPLETTLDPATSDWMTDFGAAVKVGMGLVVSGLPDAPVRVSRLVVVGARGTLDPSDSVAELEALLTAHHYSRGIALPGPGTATNATPGAPSGYSSRPDLASVVALESRRYVVGGGANPLCTNGAKNAGSELAAALGVSTGPFEYVAGADAATQQVSRTLRDLLVRATHRHLAGLTTGIFDPGTLESVLGFGVQNVSPVGPLPALRIGPQPYGVLPVLLPSAAQPAAGTFERTLLTGLDQLRAIWQTAADGLDRIGRPGTDPATALVRILQQDAVARRVAFRPLLGPQSSAEMASGLAADDLALVNRARAGAANLLVRLGASAAGSATSPLVQMMHLPFAPPLGVPLVEHAALPAGSPQHLAAYLEEVASTQPERLLQNDFGGSPRPLALLFSIARLALLEAADDAARTALVGNGASAASWEDEVVPTVFVDPYGTPLARLQAPDPADPIETLAFHLSEQGARAAVLSGVRALIRSLKAVDPQGLEDLLRATLGLFSHRLDAWYTAMASGRLAAIRNTPATAIGLNVGAYGVLEDIGQSPRALAAGSTDLFTNPLNGGFVHAPSAGHAVTAAVLRSAHLAHAAAGHGTAFSIELSSARVRSAVELFDGVRGGQPLPALLGYVAESALADEGLQGFISGLRSAAPLLANQLTPSSEPTENVAASNVVDGLALLTLAGYDGAASATVTELWTNAPALGPLPDQDTQTRLARALARVQDALDSAADLAVAESVYQTVQGNPGRAGGVADGLAGAPVPPPDVAVAQTPRTGVAVTQRLAVLLPAPAPEVDLTGVDPDGWAWTPRAMADPRIELWARASLPATEQILVRTGFLDRDGGTLAAADRDLASLNAAAATHHRPDLLVGARDLLQVADPQVEPGAASLDQRLRALVDLDRPAGTDEAVLTLDYGRGSSWGAGEFSIGEAAEVTRAMRVVLGHARPFAAEDLTIPGAPAPAGPEPTDLAGRADTAGLALTDCISALTAADDAAGIRAALFAADLLGATGAAPSSVRDSGIVADDAIAESGLRRQAASVLAELQRRDGARVSAGDAAGQLAAVFGPDFTVLPVLTPVDPLTALLGPAATPAGATPAAASAWLSRAAQVRGPVEALDRLIGYIEAAALAGTNRPAPTRHVGQVGGAPGERWVALPPAGGESVPGGRVGVVAITPGPDLPGDGIAGLLVDEWIEVVPSTHETTSISFNLDAPSAEPPQVLLLGVPPVSLETWTAQAAVAIVEEALSLAQIRLVDIDDLAGIGQLVPAFVTVENPDGDAIGLDVQVLTEQEA